MVWLSVTGAVMVIAVTSLIGNLLSKSYKERPKELKRWIFYLQHIVTQIRYMRLPFPTIFQQLNAMTASTSYFSAFFNDLDVALNQRKEPIHSAWHHALDLVQNKWHLTRDDRELLHALSDLLGKIGQDEQLKHFQAAIETLTSHEGAAMEDKKKYERIFSTLGLLVGVLLVVLLM